MLLSLLARSLAGPDERDDGGSDVVVEGAELGIGGLGGHALQVLLGRGSSKQQS